MGRAGFLGGILVHSIMIVILVMPLSVSAAGLGYEAGANPFEQTSKAAKQAAKEGKLVLLIAGGDWCRWCHVLDSYLGQNRQVYNQLKQTFVITKIYIGEDNMNEEFFARLPAAAGYPYFWVLSSDMAVVGVQDTAALEEGDNGYNSDHFQSFISYWRARL